MIQLSADTPRARLIDVAAQTSSTPTAPSSNAADGWLAFDSGPQYDLSAAAAVAFDKAPRPRERKFQDLLVEQLVAEDEDDRIRIVRQSSVCRRWHAEPHKLAREVPKRFVI
jgi:hypothetical protein